MDVYSLPGVHEPVSAATHLLGATVFGVLGVALVRRSRGHPLRAALLSVYVFSCCFLLTMSGVYHMLSDGTARAVLHRLDKAAIFVLIAGTHTPVQGLFFRGFWRWGGLAAMWGLVGMGITLFMIFFDNLPEGLGTSIYLALGWIAGTAGLVLWHRRGFRFVRALVAGGVVYSVGALLLGLEWPTPIPGIIGPHELWHFAVLTGVTLHWRFMERLGSGELDRLIEP